MISSNLYNYTNVLYKAAASSVNRQDVLTNNIANVDTPNFKRHDVSFGSVLDSVISGNHDIDTAVRNISLEDLNDITYTDPSSLSYRLDGNNVDIDTESAYLAENQIRYNTLIDSMSQEFSRIREAIK